MTAGIRGTVDLPSGRKVRYQDVTAEVGLSGTGYSAAEFSARSAGTHTVTRALLAGKGEITPEYVRFADAVPVFLDVSAGATTDVRQAVFEAIQSPDGRSAGFDPQATEISAIGTHYHYDHLKGSLEGKTRLIVPEIGKHEAVRPKARTEWYGKLFPEADGTKRLRAHDTYREGTRIIIPLDSQTALTLEAYYAPFDTIDSYVWVAGKRMWCGDLMHKGEHGAFIDLEKRLRTGKPKSSVAYLPLTAKKLANMGVDTFVLGHGGEVSSETARDVLRRAVREYESAIQDVEEVLARKDILFKRYSIEDTWKKLREIEQKQIDLSNMMTLGSLHTDDIPLEPSKKIYVRRNYGSPFLSSSQAVT